MVDLQARAAYPNRLFTQIGFSLLAHHVTRSMITQWAAPHTDIRGRQHLVILAGFVEAPARIPVVKSRGESVTHRCHLIRKYPCRPLRRIAIFGGVDSDAITDAMRDAVDALTRANVVLRDSADPLAAAADSALSCAATLMELHQRRAKGEDVDVVVLRDALGAARALVSEVSFAVREKC
jgi:hypothetical protein